MERIPPIKWSQTPFVVQLVLSIPRNKDTVYEPTVAFTETSLCFKAEVDGAQYAVDSALQHPIVAAASKWSFLPNGAVLVVLQKKGDEGTDEGTDEGSSADEGTISCICWSSPFRGSAYKAFLAIDWERWQDDESSESGGDDESRPSFSPGGEDGLSGMMESLQGDGGSADNFQKMFAAMGGGSSDETPEALGNLMSAYGSSPEVTGMMKELDVSEMGVTAEDEDADEDEDAAEDEDEDEDADEDEASGGGCAAAEECV